MASLAIYFEQFSTKKPTQRPFPNQNKPNTMPYKMDLSMIQFNPFYPSQTIPKKPHRNTDGFGYQAMAVDDWSTTTSQQIYQEHGQGHGHFSWNVTVVYTGMLIWHIYWNNMYILPITTRLPYIPEAIQLFVWFLLIVRRITHISHIRLHVAIGFDASNVFIVNGYLKFVHRTRRQMFESRVWAIIKVVFYQSSKGLGNNYESTDHR